MSDPAPTNEQLIETVRSIIPPLTGNRHKGQCGRIAVIGGCQEYTGAPYFAAYSALRVGCDLSHVFCVRDAAPVIKSYSPELIVHPTLDSEDDHWSADWLNRMHSVVIGPGLGRDKRLLATAQRLLENLIKNKTRLPIIIDADGLYMLSCNVEAVRGQTQIILTPNHVEFNRLLLATGFPVQECLDIEVGGGELKDRVKGLSEALGGVTVLLKGQHDIISNGKQVLVCSVEGSLRRCGGQGDLLSGALATFSHWSRLSTSAYNNNAQLTLYSPGMIAGYAACVLTRECARRAFERNHRATVTTDLISEIPEAFCHLFNS